MRHTGAEESGTEGGGFDVTAMNALVSGDAENKTLSVNK